MHDFSYLMFQGGAVLRHAKRQSEKAGYDPETGLHLEKAPKYEETQIKLGDSKSSIVS